MIVCRQCRRTSRALGQHRIMGQGDSARDFVSSESMKNAGILCVFPIFHTARLGQKIRRSPRLPLCGAALDLYNRFFPFNLGMIAPGNHWDFDSLRAAPPARCRSMVHASVRNASLPPALVRGVVRVAHTGTGGSPYNRLHLQDSCHSEPVLKLVWESPSSL